MTADTWDERYRNDRLPWDTGRPESLLVQMVRTWPSSDCHAIDIGCGTGANAVWLAQQGFTVTGIDISGEAVRRARERAAETAVTATFIAGDFLDWLPDRHYGFAFDRGCLHAQHAAEDRRRFVGRVEQSLSKGGLWLSLIGNGDDPVDRETGPPQWTAREVVEVLEPRFTILRLEALTVDSRHAQPPLFWRCLTRKRF